MTTEDVQAQTVRTETSRPGPARTVWEAQFPWEGARLLDRLRSLPFRQGPLTVHAYVSESPEVRAMLRMQMAEHLRALGLEGTVRVRSAYKTGYFWLTEEVQPLWRRAQADRLTVTWPSGPEGSEGRFLQELYPLAALMEREGLEVVFLPGSAGSGYRAALHRGATQVWTGECFIPLHPRLSTDGRADVPGPTGWLQVRDASQSLYDQRFPTDGELFWDWYTATVLPKVLDLASERPGLPVFRNLSVTLQLSEPDIALDVLDEHVSMTEALSEEVYFGTVDALKRHLGAAPGSRTLMPGRIVPTVTSSPATPGWTRVILSEWADRELPPAHAPSRPDTAELLPVRADSAVPWNPRQTWQAARAQAERFGLEWHIPAMSVEGRPVPSVVRRAAEPSAPNAAVGVIVTGGQHANETTGPVAAVQFIRTLADTPLPFAVLPLENPDGAALHRALIQLNPSHMHHAARYTSLGDDLEARVPRVRGGLQGWETGGRVWAAEAVGARQHLNLHGYPAHEWVRPYSGYAPFGFESWALPAGFVTIIWFWPGLENTARALAESVASRLHLLPEVAEHARRACRASAAHSTRPHYQLIQGLPFILAERPGGLCPLTVITEAPDETIYGEPFRMFVRAHLAVCEASVEYIQNEPAW